MKRLFTSESVTEGHPDKVCDQISDAILDEILFKDENARVACETVVTTGLVLTTGEITTNCYVDVENIVRQTIREIGYDKAEYGFNCDSCAVLTSFKNQSSDIALGVDSSADDSNGFGAGDQGMMFGFACNETKAFMPLPIYLSHKLTKRLADVRKSGLLSYLRPDGKSQVTVEYDDDKAIKIDTIVISAQHDTEINYEELKSDIIENVIKPVVDENVANIKCHINPTGRFVIGGPQSDSGLTGRKIIVDTYGGYASHGGGAFSGKDPTKVDRSGAYMARYIAKNIVASQIADKCEIELAYAIGIAQPVSVYVNTFGTGKITDSEIEKLIVNNIDLTPTGIINKFKLQRPIYKQLAAYGHFGREDLDLPWERLDCIGLFDKGNK